MYRLHIYLRSNMRKQTIWYAFFLPRLLLTVRYNVARRRRRVHLHICCWQIYARVRNAGNAGLRTAAKNAFTVRRNLIRQIQLCAQLALLSDVLGVLWGMPNYEFSMLMVSSFIFANCQVGTGQTGVKMYFKNEGHFWNNIVNYTKYLKCSVI